ncbi:hypothetical protein ARMSODRAFT_214322 [Armillaria solidipes]|uniref:Uncharacterized protein n=1 Tax=Armillaria solidipes TaxID=1076256 RepID=A0A2H3BBR1_9AGAR|nr:hypothetical protein ARMSODRAFT_214322 [Armillaria solidipes]
MADIASSIPGLIRNIDTVVGYLKRVDDAPKERDRLLRELHYLDIYLPPIKNLINYSSNDDPWLVTLQQSHHRFKKISAILDWLKEKLLDESVKRRWKLRWPFTKEDVADDLYRIKRFKTFILGAMQHDNRALLHVMQETLGKVNGNVKRIAENRYVTRQIQKVEKETKMAEWIASQVTGPEIIMSRASRSERREPQSTPTLKHGQSLHR